MIRTFFSFIYMIIYFTFTAAQLARPSIGMNGVIYVRTTANIFYTDIISKQKA